MAKKRKDIKTLVNEAMDRIELEQTMDKYCKYYDKLHKQIHDVIWNKYRNMTLDNYLKLKEKDKQIIKNYMDENNCPVSHLFEYQGAIQIHDRLQWIDILSWGKGKIKRFIEEQKELIERCRKSPKCLIIDDYLPF